MAEKIRVLIQMQHTPELNMARSRATAPSVPLLDGIAGFHLDSSYSPIQVPRKERRRSVQADDVGRVFAFDARPEVSTYLVRGEVEDEEALEQLTDSVALNPNAVGVFSDPRISTIATCPQSPIGNH